jgi:MATE family multidrug resistance protein
VRQAHTLQGKIHQLGIILLPIFITQLSLCSLSFFDTMMSGHASQNDLAGVAIGSNLWMPVFTGITGVLMALTPIIAQLNGAGRHKEMPFAVVQASYLAVLLAGIVIIAGVFLVHPVLSAMNLEPALFRFFLAQCCATLLIRLVIRGSRCSLCWEHCRLMCCLIICWFLGISGFRG